MLIAMLFHARMGRHGEQQVAPIAEPSIVKQMMLFANKCLPILVSIGRLSHWPIKQHGNIASNIAHTLLILRNLSCGVADWEIYPLLSVAIDEQ